jgi:hypothetical protein
MVEALDKPRAMEVTKRGSFTRDMGELYGNVLRL